MASLVRRFSFLVLVLVVSIAVAACDSSGDATTSSATDGTGSTEATTTTEAPLTSLPTDAIPGTHSPSISDEVADQMRAQIGSMILSVEENRGLPFLSIPTVTILDDAAFTARVNETLQEDLDPDEIASQQAMLVLLGMLESEDDLGAMLVELYTEQVAGFYDPDEAELVVPVSVDGISPLEEIVIAHELTHALTDQHFDFNPEYERRLEDGTGDDATGILALIEGDASYQQFIYLEDMDPSRAAQAALESLGTDTAVLDSVPDWMVRDLAFPYNEGLVFTGFLMTDGGLKAVDEAYQSPPVSSEQILDPNKFVRGEGPETLAPLTVELDGWELADEGTLGEWGVRLMLMDTLTPGALSQASSGWGNDTYRLFTNGADTALAWSYLAETVEDAEDLTNALLSHARDAMGAAGSQESGGGLLFPTGDTWVFIDRIDDQIFFVASTNAAAGTDLRDQLGL